MEALIPDSAASSTLKALPPSRFDLSRWARENPAGFAGLWFAAAAGLLAARALVFLPTLVVSAWSSGGAAGRQVGAVAVAYVCFSPSLLALMVGSLLGGSIVSPGHPDGWAPAARGASIGAVSLVVWLLMGTALLRLLSASIFGGWGELPPGAAEAVGLVLFGPFLIVTAVGAGAGYLLHVLIGRSSREEPSSTGQQARLES